jgi:hypothetical protein
MPYTELTLDNDELNRTLDISISHPNSINQGLGLEAQVFTSSAQRF